MRVITQGKKPQDDYPMMQDCNGCNAVLEVEFEDTFTERADRPLGYNVTVYKCCECSRTNMITKRIRK